MPIRSLLPSDRDAVVEILEPKTDNPFRPEEVACAIELLDAVLDPPEGGTYEARVLADPERDQPLAYACFGKTPMTDATYDLYWLVTSAAERGRGLGQKLLVAIEGELEARQARNLRVETSSLEGQGGALRFYRKVGYREVGRIEDFYRPGDHLITLLKRF